MLNISGSDPQVGSEEKEKLCKDEGEETEIFSGVEGGDQSRPEQTCW